VSRTTLVVASANPAKVGEIAELLDQFELLPRPATVAEVVEDGATLLENARLKAEAICAATGFPAVADDTGLFVAALGGAPGVHSARFAGPEAIDAENVAKLLDALAGASDRRAEFRTCALVRWPDGTETVATGTVTGTIAIAPRGSHGFGYDPVFVPDDGPGLTFAEMGPAAKHAVSHRGRAFRALADLLSAGAS
jgi:XTP/dITP diphosphohydrolase